MALKRIIARMDIKQDRVIKGMHLEGWRFLPDSPGEYCLNYYHSGIDEIIFIDVVASLYGRDKLVEILKKSTENIFVPLTAGGGIRTLDDATDLLRGGADKVAVCTGAIKRPELITEISKMYGAQCCVVSIQAKRNKIGSWDAFYDIGRENSGWDVVEWAVRAVELGAGEILLTSIDNEGMRKGFDNELISAVSSAVNVPVIASGGMGSPADAVSAFSHGADAVAAAFGLHYGLFSAGDVKAFCNANGESVRPFLN